MKRAVGRTYRRMKGAHPRRPRSRTSALAEFAGDVLLAAAWAGILSGLVLLVWAALANLRLSPLVSGVALLAAGVVLLLLWERVAWEPFADELADQLSELT